MSDNTADLTGIRTSHQIRNADYRALDRTKLSPMYQHYVEVKEQYPHALLLYRCGDFFETFFQDAITIARELELVLTSKEGGKEIGRVPMTGVPHHAVDRYCAILVEKGYAIAMCDQMETAAEAAESGGGLVRREVVRVLTPGTIQEEEMLQSRRNNFLAAIVLVGDNWGLAYTDISTGEFLTTQSTDLEVLTQELMRLQPPEILIPIAAPDLNRLLRPGETSDLLPTSLPNCFCYAMRPLAPFTLPEAKQRLLDTFKMRSLESLGCTPFPLAVRAAGGLLEYLEATQKSNPVALQPLRTYSLGDYLVLDHQSRRNLEITQTVRDGNFQGSLLWALDRTCTAMGGRALRRWILQPLLDIHSINKRQNTIQELVENTFLRQDLQQLLKQIYDIERLTGKAGSGRASARDLVALADSFLKLPELSAIARQGKSPFLKTLHNVPPELEALGQDIAAHLVEHPPIHLKDGGIIRPGINAQLDEMRTVPVEIFSGLLT